MTWLFRGKSVEEAHDQSIGDWIYGDLVHRAIGKTDIYREDGDMFEVDPDSVGLWTGRVDKNGNKVFSNSRIQEGKADDIIWNGVAKIIRPVKGEVYWNDVICGFNVKMLQEGLASDLNGKQLSSLYLTVHDGWYLWEVADFELIEVNHD